jgi:hypothetical protein
MNKLVRMVYAGRIPIDANVQMRHLDRFGNPKPIFQENPLCIFLIKWGILSPLWINGPHAARLSRFLGYWATEKDGRNLITDAGRAAVASRINGSGGAAAFTAIGQGTGATAANAADTTLQTEVKADGTAASGVHALATASVTVSRVTTTVTNDTAQLVGTIAETATIAVTESGVFNADTNGTLLCRQTFSAVNVISGDSIQLTWKIKAA